MLNLEYLQEGKLDNFKTINSSSSSSSDNKTSNSSRNKTRPKNYGKRSLYATCYQILEKTLELQQARIQFVKENEDKRHCSIALQSKYAGGDSVKPLVNINGVYYNKQHLGSARNIREQTDLNYGTVANSLVIMCKLNLVEYDKSIRSYNVTSKGVEFMVTYEDLTKLFPYTTPAEIYTYPKYQQEQQIE